MDYIYVLVFFLPLLLMLFFMFFWRFKTQAKTIDQHNIQIEKTEDNKVLVSYKNYKFTTKMEYSSRKYLVPKIDMNGNKIGMIDREKLHNYLIENYDDLSLPTNMIAIKDNEVKNYFTNMTICNEDEKNKFLNRKHFIGIYVFILVLILPNLSIIIHRIIKQELSLVTIIILIILTLLLIVCSLLAYKGNQKEKNCEVYSCEVDVYDKKEVTFGEEWYYYVKVYDGKQHVLNKWFSINKNFYKNGTKGTLYLIQYENTCETYFEKGVDSNE